MNEFKIQRLCLTFLSNALRLPVAGLGRKAFARF